MSKFLQIPALNIGDSGKWVLNSDLVYRSHLLEREIRVPKGFETDLASIPRVTQPLIPVNGKHRAAAILHDYLYSMGGSLPPADTYTRKGADGVFLEAMKACGVSWWKRQAMYAAVRVGGWVCWGSK